MIKSTKSVPIQKVIDGEINEEQDILAVESPLEIQLSYGAISSRIKKSVSITMRTPGHDLELALGFLFTEGILQNITQVSGNEATTTPEGDVLEITLNPEVSPTVERLERNSFMTSSCGVCGKSTLGNLRVSPPQSGTVEDEFNVSSELIMHLPEVLRIHQPVFEQTGGLHASSLFDREGGMQMIREDVGRHNALDKIIGAAFIKNQLPLNQSILVLSGRISFELVQKATMAGIPVIAAVGAPSSLAVEMAEEAHITLIGFVRGHRFNVYAGKHRVIYPATQLKNA